MVKAGKDVAQVPEDPLAVMGSYGQAGAKYATKEIPAIETLSGGATTTTLGVVPEWWRLLLKRLPFFRRGEEDFGALLGMVVLAVSKRLEVPTDRNDVLSKLLAGKDEQVSELNLADDFVVIKTCFIEGQSDRCRGAQYGIIFASRWGVRHDFHVCLCLFVSAT